LSDGLPRLAAIDPKTNFLIQQNIS